MRPLSIGYSHNLPTATVTVLSNEMDRKLCRPRLRLDTVGRCGRGGPSGPTNSVLRQLRRKTERARMAKENAGLREQLRQALAQLPSRNLVHTHDIRRAVERSREVGR